MRKLKIKALFSVCVIILISLGWLPTYSQSIEGTLPLDPSIRHGRLHNGFTYYIKDVKNGSNKINLGLFVKVGSAHEKPDEIDFSHAIEHLAFKCAKDFPLNLYNNHELHSDLGITKSDIKGRSGIWFTRYDFNVPSQHKEALNTGLRWFGNILELKLTADKINGERGSLRQEFIYRRGDNLEHLFIQDRLRSKLLLCRQDKSNFFEHNQQYSSSSLIKFYNKWYTPEHMAVVIVGDISDIDNIEKRVKAQFSIYKSPESQIKSLDCGLKYLKGPDGFISLERESDKKWEEVDIRLYFRDKKIRVDQGGLEGLRRIVIWEVINKMINKRFQEAGRGYNRDFYAYGSSPSPNKPFYGIRVKTSEKQEKRTLSEVIRILLQVKQFGFSREEWEKTQGEQIKIMTQTSKEDSEYWIEQIKGHYLNEIALPVNKAIDLQHWFSKISWERFNALTQQYISEMPNDIGIMAPKPEGNLWYTENEIRKWINKIIKEDRKPYKTPRVPSQLLSKEKISNLKEIGYKDLRKTPFGVRELKLNNGVKVVLDTLHLGTTINVHGFSPKGASYFPNEDFFSAINAASIVKNSGIGRFNKFEIDRYLAGTSFWQGVQPYIGYREAGIKGNAALKDLETMLQLVYLYFTVPRIDYEAFIDWREKSADLKPNLIPADFYTLIREFLGDRSKDPKGTKFIQGITETDMGRAYHVYKELFGNASDFTFIIKGDFSTQETLPLITKYLGNLPRTFKNQTNSSQEESKKPSFSVLNGPMYKEFYLQDVGAQYTMKSVRYSLNYIGRAEKTTDWKEHIRIQALGHVMKLKVQELRFSKNYSLYLMKGGATFNRDLLNYEFWMSLECSSGELEMLREACKTMVMKIRNGELSQEMLEVVKRSFYQIPQTEIYNLYRFNEPLVSSSQVNQYIKSLTLKDIHVVAQKYLNKKNSIEFVYKSKKGRQ